MRSTADPLVCNALRRALLPRAVVRRPQRRAVPRARPVDRGALLAPMIPSQRWRYIVQQSDGPHHRQGPGRWRWEFYAGPFVKHANAARLVRALRRQQRGHVRRWYRVRALYRGDGW